jgi:hypothetical protein
MSSGTGSDVTLEEAKDLLHKLITESIKVQAVITSPSGVAATVPGLVKGSPDGDLFVLVEQRPGEPMISFNPSEALSRKYGDRRAFSGPSPELELHGAPRLTSALIFLFRDGVQVALFEIAEKR